MSERKYTYRKSGRMKPSERKLYPLKKFSGENYFNQYDLNVQGDYDTIVVCINKGSGWEPVTFLLRHQLSQERLDKLFGSNDVTSVCIMPVNSEHRLIVEKKAGKLTKVIE